MTQTVRLELRPSRWLAACLGGLHAAALYAAFASLSSGVFLLVAAGVALSAVGSVRAALLRAPDSVRELELSGDNSARWRAANGDSHEAVLAHEGHVSAWLVVLALDPVGPEAGRAARRWVALAPDSADPEALRQLRVRLRHHQAPGMPPDNHARG